MHTYSKRLENLLPIAKKIPAKIKQGFSISIRLMIVILSFSFALMQKKQKINKVTQRKSIPHT